MIKGTVYDQSSGETLPGADVYFSDQHGNPGLTTTGTATDSNGNYTLSSNGAYLTASYTGYSPVTVNVESDTIIFQLHPAATALPEVEITGQKTTPATITPVVLPVVRSTGINPLYIAVGGALAIVLSVYIYTKHRKK